MWRHRRVVGNGIRNRPAEHRKRAREYDLGRARESPAALEQRAGRIDVDAHADVELRFGLSADDRSEMEDRVRVRCDGLLDQGRIGQIARDDANPRFAECRRYNIEEDELLHFAGVAARVGKSASRENAAGKTAAQEAGAASNHNAHWNP